MKIYNLDNKIVIYSLLNVDNEVYESSEFQNIFYMIKICILFDSTGIIDA